MSLVWWLARIAQQVSSPPNSPLCLVNSARLVDSLIEMEVWLAPFAIPVDSNQKRGRHSAFLVGRASFLNCLELKFAKIAPWERLRTHPRLYHALLALLEGFKIGRAP